MELKLTLGNGNTSIPHLTFCVQLPRDPHKKKYNKREELMNEKNQWRHGRDFHTRRD